MAFIPPPGSGSAGNGGEKSAPTVDQVFTQKKLWQWYSSRITNPFNGVSEKGLDYSTTYGTPVGVPVGGNVVRIVHNNNAINDIVEIQTADGAVWLYQHINAKVKVGDTLQCGSIIGTENGLPIDQYSTGPHIEVRYCPPGKWGKAIDSWNEPWVNPASVFDSIGTRIAGTVTSGNTSSLISNITGGNFTNPLAPNATVTAVLAAIDDLLLVKNPFNVQPTTFNILGATITDPISYVQDVTNEFVLDISALFWRVAFAALGIFILYKVASNFIDFGALVGTATGTAKTVVQAGAMLA
jgi:murein DD-endopeptidase MepM/ murein hydrolase activator NlpD